jgi:DnaK suppressor protein
MDAGTDHNTPSPSSTLAEDAAVMDRPPPSIPTDIDLQAAADRLRRERDQVGARIAGMAADLESVFAASVDSNADDEHDPEGQTIAYERSQLQALLDGAHARLADIDEAVLRLHQGRYGVCEVCHTPIPAARLEARPTARTCVRHAASAEREVPRGAMTSSLGESAQTSGVGGGG